MQAVRAATLGTTMTVVGVQESPLALSGLEPLASLTGGCLYCYTTDDLEQLPADLCGRVAHAASGVRARAHPRALSHYHHARA